MITTADLRLSFTSLLDEHENTVLEMLTRGATSSSAVNSQAPRHSTRLHLPADDDASTSAKRRLAGQMPRFVLVIASTRLSG